MNDIIARDIIRLHRIKRADLLKNLLILIASSVGSRTSFNKIAKALEITVDAVKECIGYFEEAFLLRPFPNGLPHIRIKYILKKRYISLTPE